MSTISPRRLAGCSGGSELSLPANRSVLVRTVDFASLVANADLIKLDVEGYEVELLTAVRGLLCARRPTLFGELLEESRRLQDFLVALCRDAGYACLLPRSSAILRTDPATIPAVAREAPHGYRDVIISVDQTLLAAAMDGQAR